MSRTVEFIVAARDIVFTYVAPVGAVALIGWYLQKARSGGFSNLDHPERPKQERRGAAPTPASGGPVVR